MFFLQQTGLKILESIGVYKTYIGSITGAELYFSFIFAFLPLRRAIVS